MFSRTSFASLFVCLIAFAALGCTSSRPVDNCANLNCDDGVECTVDSCSADTGQCVNEPDDSKCPGGFSCDPSDGCIAQPCESDSDCDDDLWCNGTESCVDGTCSAGEIPTCDDGVECTTDSCDEDNDDCTYTPDDSLCAEGETCDAVLGCAGEQTCTVDSDCDDSIDCTVDVCDSDFGTCSNTPDDSLCDDGYTCDPELGCVSGQDCAEDSDCDDGFYCNGAERCVDGSCVAGTAIVCDDGVACTVDSCDEDTQGCTNAPDHSLCDAGELCDPESGCVAVPCENNGDCDDGLFCNGEETCDNGTCVAGTAIVCDDGVDCTIDTCDEDAQACIFIADDSFCDDAHWCNGAETCSETDGCVAGEAPNCDDGVDCTVDSCDDDNDVCAHSADNSLCDDGQWCNGAETCSETDGCVAGEAPNCDDGVDCTVDSCDDDNDVCAHSADDSLCDDGQWCNGAETCNETEGCMAGEAPNCDDGVDCTVDSCDEDIDSCVSSADDLMCDDTNPCTEDVCSPQISPDSTGCIYNTLQDGTSCSDDNVCNGDEVCRGGMCQAGIPLICTDDNPCTLNYCSPGVGCMREPEPEGTSCSDGNLCNGDEVCDADGTCQDGTPPDCDDLNPCTADFCLPAEGCQNVNNIDVCDDGDDCTVNDRCVEGRCIGVSMEICGDGLDNDCNGTPDDGCGGIGTYVAPWGDNSNPGTMDEPLATITAGINNALVIGAPQVVYVAGNNSYKYVEDLIMQPGISVYGGYSDDGNWDHDPAMYGTILKSTNPQGVRFVNPSIDSFTVMDGMILEGADVNGSDAETTAVTIQGCSPTLNDCSFVAGSANTCRAISVIDGAAPTIASGDISGSSCRYVEMVQVESADMGLYGTHIAVSDAGRRAVGIQLTSAGSVEIMYNQIEGGDTNGSLSAGIASRGEFGDLAVSENYIAAGSATGNDPTSTAIFLNQCEGGVASITGNGYLAGGNASSMFGQANSAGVTAIGNCQLEISNNGMIVGSTVSTDSAVGIVCSDQSMCDIIGNSVIAGVVGSEQSATNSSAGIYCEDSCNSIVGNQVIYGGVAPSVTGVSLAGSSSPLMDSNNIYGGECPHGGFISEGGVGLYMDSAGAQIVNNVIFGGFCANSVGLQSHHVNYDPIIAVTSINSNYINAGGRDSGWGSQSVGVLMDSEGDVPSMDEYRNNIVDGGYTSSRVPVLEADGAADPVVFDFNDVLGGTDALYVDEGSQALLSIAEVNALTDMETGFNLSVYPDLVNPIPFGNFHLNDSSPLIDAGTGDEAPDHDFEGDARPTGNGFDVGADEL